MTKAKNLTGVVPDISKNRLYISFPKILNKAVANSFYTDLRFSVADLQQDFDVIADFTKSQIIYLNAMPVVRKIMEYIVSSKPGSIFRVIHQQRLIYKQLINLTFWTQTYRPIYVSTLEEAEEMLSSSTKRKGIRIHPHNESVFFSCEAGEGQGIISNISISGCAVKNPTRQVRQGETIQVRITLPTQDSKEESISLEADIVRMDDGFFAVVFNDVDTELQNKLWDGLIQIARTSAPPD